jgi:DNA mismatch repair protein MutL
MGRIQILSDDLANKIAAGEVVERPASVVKELLENSLDAGATDFRIELEAAGRKLIRITDNGSGMLRDDAMLAFERHATSKLRDTKDLAAISTLGFRGEALPSIASVSRLTLETRAPEESTGSLVEFAGGKLFRCEEAALPAGTVITVRDLFYNVPARKKFLRSEQTELAHIAQLVTHYSLAHHDKRFDLRHNGAELLSVIPVQSARERVFQVFGAQVLEELVEVPAIDKQIEMPPAWDFKEKRPIVGPPEFRHYRLSGFISQPQYQKTNRNSTYLFINGRLIKDRLLLHALTAAYANLMPNGVYPFAILFLDCDPEEVDVNVHPAKTEVRFRHSGTVHDFVRDVVRDRLMEARPASALPRPPQPVIPSFNSPQPAAALPFSNFTQSLLTHDSQLPRSVLSGSVLSGPLLPEGPLLPDRNQVDFSTRSAPPVAALSEITPIQSLASRIPDTHGALPRQQDWDVSQNLAAIADLKILGQLHDSFIVATGPDGLWIIDQHVAHERILFEQVLERRDTGAPDSQQLLLPLLIDVTPAQLIRFEKIAEELNSYGYDATLFGPKTIAIKAAPSGLQATDVERALFEILEIADRDARSFSLEEVRANICASIACRASIKINTPLDHSKMEWLLQNLAQTRYPMSCPHGRPIALRYSMREILRSFHRI